MSRFDARKRCKAAPAIRGLDSAAPVSSGSPVAPAPGSDSVDFGSILGSALHDAGQAERTADNAATRFADGDPDIGIHEVMIASEKAQVMLRYAVTLKNKLLEAYKDLMNTPV